MDFYYDFLHSYNESFYEYFFSNYLKNILIQKYDFELKNNLNISNNTNILFINHGYFNPLLKYSHFIKKFNIHLYIHDISNKNIQKILNDIKNEDCEDNIHILEYYDPNLINNDPSFYLFFDFIIIHHSSFFNDFLNIFIENTNNIIKNNGILIYLHSICNNNNIQNKKNKIRNFIKNITKIPLGNTINLIDLLELNNHLITYKQIDYKLYHHSNYIIYGDHNFYIFFLQKNN